MCMEPSKYQKRVLTIPNLLSALRICLIPVFVCTYCIGRSTRATAWVLLFSGLTDIADGWIARRFHMVSDLGKALDPIADKLTQAALLFCLAAKFPKMIPLLVLLALKEITTGVATLIAIKRTGTVKGAAWHGKLLTFLLYGMMLLHLLWPEITPSISDCTINACLGVMMLSFALYGLRISQDLSA